MLFSMGFFCDVYSQSVPRAATSYRYYLSVKTGDSFDFSLHTCSQENLAAVREFCFM